MASGPASPPTLSRPEVLRVVDSVFADQPVVLTLGGTIREMVAVAGRRPNHLHVLDAMGLPAAIGLGLALGLERQPPAARHEKVLVVEGDGSLLMGFSTLATIGSLRPRSLVLLVLDNGVYLATGGQPTAASAVDFVAVARACGWPEARDVAGEAGALREALTWARCPDTTGPVLLRCRVTTETIPTGYFLEDPVVLGHEFRSWLRRAG